jgi:hypothetical protein
MTTFRMKPSPPNPGLDRLLVEAQKAYDKMTPAQKREMHDAQRKSWVVGNMLLDHPHMSRDEVEEIYEKVVLGIGL